MTYPSVYPTGATIYNPEKCWSGYTVFQAKEVGAMVIDMNGSEVQLWKGLHGFPNKILPGGFVMGSLGERNNKYGMQDQIDLVQVDWDGVRLRIPVKDLQPGKGSSSKSPPSSMPTYKIEKRVNDEIDLRGQTADEAIEAVEKYLSDAVMSGFSSVRIIHGKGTGVLRREISRYLKGHTRVKSQRLGSWNEGDTGVTVVELR